MSFVTLDDKAECVGYYSDGKLIFGELPPDSETRTWKHHIYLNNKNIKYANILVSNKNIDEVCPEQLRDYWESLNLKMKAFIRSFIESKVSLKDNCFFDLVPRKFLIDYCEIKCQIIDWIFDNVEEPHDYKIKHEIEILLEQIKKQNITFDQELIKSNLHDTKIKQFYQSYCLKNNQIEYDQFSSKTGRLTTCENSFPILNISKDLRKYIKAENDFLLDIDYNAAEVRVFLALNDIEQPPGDIHEWNMHKFNYENRSEAKRDFISWLYGKKNARESQFVQYYDINKIKNKFWNGTTVQNYYGRKIEADQFHSVNYIVQSTTADMSLRQVLKVNELLKDCQSKIKMIIHDNIVIDMKKEEKHLIKDIIRVYNDTDFGTFKSSVKIGKNLGNMRNIL